VNQPEELHQPEGAFADMERDLTDLERELTDLERELTQALLHVSPPDGFAQRMMARIQPPGQPLTAINRAKALPMRRSRLWASGALAATLLAAAFFTQQTHARHQQQKAERAQQQFEAGIRITDNTLEHVRQQLQQAGVQIGN
jgi:hypothetical protein